MRITRSEAMDVFRKWFSEQSSVRCEASFSMLAFSVVGRIIKLDDKEIKILSSDKFHEVALAFRPEMQFGYGDFRGIPREGAIYESGIVVFFGSVPSEGEPDTIEFAEVK